MGGGGGRRLSYSLRVGLQKYYSHSLVSYSVGSLRYAEVISILFKLILDIFYKNVT